MKLAADGNSGKVWQIGKFRRRIGREPSSPVAHARLDICACVHEPEATVYSITSGILFVDVSQL